MVSDEKDAKAGTGQFAHGLAEFDLAGNVEGVAGFVEKQGVRMVNQGTGDQSALGFSRGHFENGAVGERGDTHAGESGVRMGAMFGVRLMIGENTRAAEKSGKDDVEAGGIRGASREEIGRNDAQSRAEFENIPEGASKNGDGRIFALKGVALASESLDEGRFTRTVGTEDADVLANGDAEGEAVEGDILAAEYGDILQIEQGRSHGQGFPRKSLEINRLGTKKGGENVGFPPPGVVWGVTDKTLGETAVPALPGRPAASLARRELP
jgi:hypothetical protein